jgi:hypothetical protein
MKAKTCFDMGEIARCIQLIRGWVGCRVCLVIMEKRISLPSQDLNSYHIGCRILKPTAIRAQFICYK